MHSIKKKHTHPRIIPIPTLRSLKLERGKLMEKSVSKNTTLWRKQFAKKFYYSILEVREGLYFAIKAFCFLIQTLTESTDWSFENTDVPPNATLTDENISLFLTERWGMEGRGEIEVAQRYINYALSNYQRPNITTLGIRNLYPDTYKTLQGIKKSKRWVAASRNGARPLAKEEAKAIMLAPVNDLDDLRHKVIASCFINMGFHGQDICRIKDENLEDQPRYKDRNGLHKPKIIINGVHTKRPNLRVRNIVACGCQGNHLPRNMNCEYAVWKKYITTKKNHDRNYKNENFKRYNNKRKATHFNGTELKEMIFMRRISKDKKTFLHQNMGKRAIANGLQYWSTRLGLRRPTEEKMKGASGRKTFCTLGEKFFKFKREALRDVSHHQTNDQFEEYVHNDYIDLEEEAHISVTMQKWAQNRFTPPVHTTTTMMLAELQENIKDLNKGQLAMMKMMAAQNVAMQYVLNGMVRCNNSQN